MLNLHILYEALICLLAGRVLLCFAIQWHVLFMDLPVPSQIIVHKKEPHLLPGDISTRLSQDWSTLQVEPQSGQEEVYVPVLDVKLELLGSDIRWVPELDVGAKSGVHSMLDDWLHAFCGVGCLVSRFDADEGKCATLDL